MNVCQLANLNNLTISYIARATMAYLKFYNYEGTISKCKRALSPSAVAASCTRSLPSLPWQWPGASSRSAQSSPRGSPPSYPTRQRGKTPNFNNILKDRVNSEKDPGTSYAHKWHQLKWGKRERKGLFTLLQE